MCHYIPITDRIWSRPQSLITWESHRHPLVIVLHIAYRCSTCFSRQRSLIVSNQLLPIFTAASTYFYCSFYLFLLQLLPIFTAAAAVLFRRKGAGGGREGGGGQAFVFNVCKHSSVLFPYCMIQVSVICSADRVDTCIQAATVLLMKISTPHENSIGKFTLCRLIATLSDA